ncbi:DNA polymerase III subunit delta' [Imhoffiella purpurea]|uniref:DNA polymerase III subunit delta' n=1 Tax=Imhoffiella purpurea TaxID=1249627 RepID=W9V743_9GAMM|nr:DNA polymerase III subunit delta' [Imhoffiella purpurea]EXJ15368.1 DNA polymerase III delta prime subunit [Imhoffiella purpurea]
MSQHSELDASPLPPWLGGIWSRLQGARELDRLAHALLICGPAGIGKRRLADALARSLLCRSRDAAGYACGRCPDCRLLEAGNHPDLVRIGPDPDSKSREISVGAVRAFSEHGSLTPSRSDWKVTLIDPADRLNPSAANALLKTLEEPSGQSLMCLVAERLGQLPATIRSRCLQIAVPVPAEDEALAWLRDRLPDPGTDPLLPLRLAQGAPFRALDELDQELFEQRRQRVAGFLAIASGRRDPVAEAALWNGQGAVRMLDWMSGWICDLLRLMAGGDAVRLTNPDQREVFMTLVQRLDPAAGHRFLGRLLECRALADTNVNHLLMLESIAIEWFRVTRGGGPGRD